MKKDTPFKKEKKPSKIHRKKKNDYDEYGDKRNEKLTTRRIDLLTGNINY